MKRLYALLLSLALLPAAAQQYTPHSVILTQQLPPEWNGQVPVELAVPAGNGHGLLGFRGDYKKAVMMNFGSAFSMSCVGTFPDDVCTINTSGGSSSSVAWGDVTGKPTTFPSTSALIGDATTLGRGLLLSSGAAAARGLLGAGTSSFDGAYLSLTGRPTLGTASALDVPASGNASSTQVVKGDDSRLSDARTPLAHNQAFSTLTSLPTTCAGYGITDCVTPTSLTSTLSGYTTSAALTSALSTKADTSALSNYLTTANAAATYLTPAAAASAYYAANNPSSYINLAASRAGFSVVVSGSAAPAYNNNTGVLTLPVSTPVVINRATITTATDGTYTWTFPTACSAAPVVQVTPQNNTANTIVNHKVTAVTAATATVATSTAVLTLNGLLNLTIPIVQVNSAQTLHLMAICP